MSHPDDILRHKLKEGDTKAFKSLFESYYQLLVGYAISITENTEVSRELVQDVFLKLWENRQKTKSEGSLKAYLFTAVNHQSLNWLRHEKIKRAYRNQSIQDIMTGVELPPQISPFLEEALRKAIDELPEKALKVFTLTQLDGLSQKEAALSLGISVKTIENQLSRSRKILQKKLRKYK